MKLYDVTSTMARTGIAKVKFGTCLISQYANSPFPQYTLYNIITRVYIFLKNLSFMKIIPPPPITEDRYICLARKIFFWVLFVKLGKITL